MIVPASTATGKVLRECIERAGLFFPDLRCIGMSACPGNKHADDRTDNDHTGKGDEILGIGDPERQVRRYKEEIECEDSDNRGKNCGFEATLERDDDHGEQVEHQLVDRGNKGVEQPPDDGDRNDKRQAVYVIPGRCRRQQGFHVLPVFPAGPYRC